MIGHVDDINTRALDVWMHEMMRKWNKCTVASRHLSLPASFSTLVYFCPQYVEPPGPTYNLIQPNIATDITLMVCCLFTDHGDRCL